MSSSQTQWIHQALTWSVFDQVGHLLQHIGSPTALVLTESQTEFQMTRLSPRARFVLVLSEEFSALLQGEPGEAPSRCQMSLSFEPDAIAQFLTQLKPALPPSLSLPPLPLSPNHPQRQTEFTMQLLGLLAASSLVEPALQQQVEQERLMNEVTALIRRSLELPVILETAVHQVRQFLQVDRLIIYQFDISAPSCLLDDTQDELPQATPYLNGITYESRRQEDIPSVLHLVEDYSATCIEGIRDLNRNKLRWAIDDCATVSISTLPLPLAMMARADLVTPIVVQDHVWGLLIAHQCFEPRQWQESEKNFLQRIAEHLAIAIYQAKLYAELQAQKQTLEQQVLERTQELHDTLIAAQSASRAKSEFLATMSHELRSPLTTIIGMAATLLRYYNAGSSAKQALPLAKQKEYLRTIQSRGEHLLALINDILELSRLESGKMMLQVKEFSLMQMGHQTIKLLQERAEAKQVKLRLDLQSWQNKLPELADIRFRADPQRVQQILLNLLSNAIKFTPEGGRVTLQIAVHGDTAILRVSDTGIGIPEGQRSLLFQKFQQLDGSYQRKYEGTGLGLALTKQLVDLHGGSIEVESTVGQGSTFTVFLPSQPLAAIEHARGKQSSNQALLHPRIVLIEDDQETAALICDLLTAANYQVVWMMESSVTAKQVEMLHPLVLIVDLSEPNLERDAIAGQLKQTLHTKVLGLTVKSGAKNATLAVDDALLKPITQPEQLIDKVSALVKLAGLNEIP